jgi:hypothetical protein
VSGTLKVYCDDHPDGASVGGHVSRLPHPSFSALLHPTVLRLPHELKMSFSMTALMPMLPDPVRRRRYVLCLAILGNKQLYLSYRNNSLFTVWSGLLWSSEAASGSTLSEIVGHVDAMDSFVMRLGPELLWESYLAGASKYTTSSSDPHYFCRADSRCYEIRDGTKSARNQQKIRGQRDKGRLLLALFLFLFLSYRSISSKSKVYGHSR